jgi:hypothetical protein
MRTSFVDGWAITLPLIIIALAWLWAWVLSPNDTDCEEDQ